MTGLITFTAQYLIVVAAVLALVYWVRLPRTYKVEAIVIAVLTGVIALALAKVGGMLVQDPRPFVTDGVAPLFPHPADNGFPSDHTLVVAAAAMVALRRSRGWGLTLFVLAIVIGGARVLAHVHHPLDIAASLVFAVLGGLVAYWIAPFVVSRIPSGRRVRTQA